MIACPTCGGDTRALETRATTSGARRRRQCSKCGQKVTTVETIVNSGRRPLARMVMLRKTDVDTIRALLEKATPPEEPIS